MRANVKRASADNVAIMVRHTSAEKTYGVWSKNEFAIGKHVGPAFWKDLKKGPASSFGEMAVSVVGDTLTLYVDGMLTHTTRDTDCDRGGIALKAVAGSGFFKDVEIRILDSVENAAAVSPSTTITEQPTQTAIASLPKEVKIVNSIGMTLVRIPAGSFEMGSPATETGRGNDEQQHEVTLTKPYYIGAYEVTQVEYQQVMNTNPSAFKFSDRHPVEQINWPQAVAFCRDLSARAAEKSAGRVYRLPTEAEWEYACRAGTTTPFSDPTRTTQHRRVDRAYLPETVAVGLGQPNRWGLYDMHGLLWEWCADRYGPYTIEPQG